VQHACAGGTLALLSVSGLVSQIPESRDSGVVICSDIARYQTSSTAEVTQGAGAAAMLVENNPKLIGLDLTTQGYCSKDVDDFFRPNGERYAQVQGRYSMECYIENFESAFEDHCRRRNMDPVQVIDSTDMFILHTPFRNMPEQAMKRLLEKHLGLVNGQTETFLESKGFYGGIDPVARVGNTYSASMYIDLAFLLKEQYEIYGNEIVGKNILLASYGSGNTMIVIAGKIMPGAPDVIAQWDLEAFFREAVQTSMIDYTLWTNGPYEGSTYNDLVKKHTIPENTFYLSSIREDGYREYEFSKQTVDGGSEEETPAHMQRSAKI
jgi:hydroxymethylglutaryl-CoA synthase